MFKRLVSIMYSKDSILLPFPLLVVLVLNMNETFARSVSEDTYKAAESVSNIHSSDLGAMDTKTENRAGYMVEKTSLDVEGSQISASASASLAEVSTKTDFNFDNLGTISTGAEASAGRAEANADLLNSYYQPADVEAGVYLGKASANFGPLEADASGPGVDANV